MRLLLYTSFRRTSGPVFRPGLGLESYRPSSPTFPHVITNSFTLLLAAVG
jgi:hypothetical protein